MNRFASLLLPLDGSPEAAKSAGCALWLAETLGATLHVLHATMQPLPGRETLDRLLNSRTQSSQVILHQFAENADTAVLNALADYGIDLVIMSARGASATAGLKSTQTLGTIAQAVVQRSAVPVLLIPVRYKEQLPWTSMLAAVSGDPAADQALKAATQLAAALQLNVTVLHVEDGPRTAHSVPFGAYTDAAHHEYPNRIEEMVRRGLTDCTPQECCCIEQVLLRCGDPAAVLLEQSRRQAGSVLALGWNGVLDSGRALVFKKLLEEAECALLIVRKTARSSAHLKVGKEIDD